MDALDRLQRHFEASIEAQYRAGQALPAQLADASDLLSNALLDNHRILVAGAGVAGGLAEIFSTYLLHQFRQPRPPFPVINLSGGIVGNAIAAGEGSEQLLARQVSVLAEQDDVLLLFGTQIDQPMLSAAISAAHDNGVSVCVCCIEGALLQARLSADDLCLVAPTDDPARALETQLLIVHALCDMLDHSILGIP